MLLFLGGLVIGAIGFWLIVDNNPAIAAKLKTVKKIVKDKIEEGN